MKISQGEKKLIWSVGLAFIILGGGFGWRSYLNREPVINIPPYPKLPNPNGFDLYVQAAKNITHATPPVDESHDRNPPTNPKVRAQQYSLARKEAWLQQNAAGFQVFQRALKTPCLHPAPRGFRFGVRYSPMRQMARNKMIESHAREMKSDWTGAMESRLDVIQMGNDISRAGPIMASLVSLSMHGQARNDIWPMIEKLDAVQCRIASTRLEGIYQKRPSLSDVLTQEKYEAQNILLDLMREPKWRVVRQLDKNADLSTQVQCLFISKNTIMQNLIQRMEVHIANTKLPYAAPKSSPPDTDPYSRVLGSVSEYQFFNFAHNDAGNALWLVALALRAYKLENGKYPAKLSELVPRYFKKIPADPFGAGESLRYKNRDNEYLLYSIGPDGVDNGGKPIAFPANASATRRKNLPQVMFDSKGDYVAGKNR